MICPEIPARILPEYNAETSSGKFKSNFSEISLGIARRLC